MIGGKQQLSLETPDCSDNRMKGFQACMLKGNINFTLFSLIRKSLNSNAVTA
jgi:hypothetical protein